jgi:nitric oxide reductase subunit B
VTYEAAPRFPERFVTSKGAVLMTAPDVQAGKAGFQKADLMDYGSLYGMGSYFGENYTAANLVRPATLTTRSHMPAPEGKSQTGNDPRAPTYPFGDHWHRARCHPP